MKLPTGSSYRIWSALFLLIIFLNFSVGCNYYSIKSRYKDEVNFPEELNKALNKKNLVLFVQDSATYLAKEIQFDQHSITAKLDTIPAQLAMVNAQLQYSASNRFKSSSQSSIVHEVRIYTDRTTVLSEGTHNIPINTIDRIDIYGHDTAKEILSWTATTVGVFGVIMLIVALTKSSCPYVYSNNGEGYAFEGESYGGAIFKPLERMDYLPLKEIDSIDQIKSIRVANLLKERQYIDQVELIELKTPPGVSALVDKYGEAYSYREPLPPISAISGDTDHSKQLSTMENGRFLFDSEISGNSHIDLVFPNLEGEAKLIINAKGSLWLDYLYGEFSKLFGDYYPTFVDRQHGRSTQELKNWIADQNLLLTVSERTISGWKMIDQFDMVGPLGEGRDMIMSIPVNPEAADQRVIRLETGFMFWELNYAGLDYSPDQIIQRKTIAPFRALDHVGADCIDLLSGNDARYLEQGEIGDFVTAYFDTDQNEASLTTCYFLGIKGYYEHVRDFQGLPAFQQLSLFKQPGYFTKYSRQNFANIKVDFFAANSEAF